MTTKTIGTSPKKLDDDPRRQSLLEAAVTVFVRHGFRKASMDEVARAAEISRQGLYLHFATKEDLFRAAVEHTLDTSLQRATARLRDAALGVEAKLVGAFDEWVGRFVGMSGSSASDLAEASQALLGPILAEREALFVEAVAKTIRASGLLLVYKASGLTARQLAETLGATARGLKYGSASRAEFVERFGVAVRVMCAPLRETP